ncbi:MAG: rhomboid family intramembrane serine protease [Lawsonibacter sp.]|nr:rhomboid family intramembrane serine protease [Lawsonibacter sp.]MCI9159303.1 rhomboid family intramembrane serine protease [Lawsonibacter sp.]
MKVRVQYNAPVVLTFALLSLGALVLGSVTGGWSTNALFCVYRSSLTDPLTYVRMVGHVLGHASYAHYMGNMMLLLVVGPPLEEKYGSSRLLFCILVTALVSGLVQFFLFPGTALLGASGIVFMMIVLSSLAGMRAGSIPLTLILVVVLYLGGELVDAATVQDNVSQLTHIVGGLCGAGLGFAMKR